MKTLRDSKGFTIVETSLVLAIAGLIFLGVFVALPTLQRNTRDAERREDMIQLANAIKKYQQNNRGALPSGEGEVGYNSGTSETTTWAGFYKNYLGGNFSDPNSGEAYKLNVVSCSATDNNCSTQYSDKSFPNEYKIGIIKGAACDGETAVTSSNPRRLAILYKLELGTYCGDV